MTNYRTSQMTNYRIYHTNRTSQMTNYRIIRHLTCSVTIYISIDFLILQYTFFLICTVYILFYEPFCRPLYFHKYFLINT